MKHSSYNYVCRNSAGNYLIFNTFTTGLVEMFAEEYKDFSEMKLDPETLSALKDNGFIIEDDVDEFAIMEFDRAYFTCKNLPRYRILTTTACNARCGYCYEAGMEISSMTQETADAVVTFIESRSPADQILNLEWFGGEPLVNAEIIDYICQKLKSDGYSFQGSIVSNGLLFTPEVIARAKNLWNLQKIQITVDGVGSVYDTVKAVPSGSFGRLMDIIEDLSSNIVVYVRMNIGDNKEDILALIRYFSERFKDNQNIFYYSYPLFQDSAEVSQKRYRDVAEINDALISSGLASGSRMYNANYKHTRCFATNYGSFTIAPDGKLYNCSHLMNPRGFIGTVWNYSDYHPNRIRFTNLNISDKCRSCILFPLCKGGCRAAELHEAPLNQCVIYKNDLDTFVNKLFEYSRKESA